MRIDIHCEDDARESVGWKVDGSPMFLALCDEGTGSRVVPCAPREGFMLLIESRQASNLCKSCLEIFYARAS
jgi:hypothetical protein